MRARRVEGVVLVVVLVFALLLAASIATFLRRATVDASIAVNRDNVARAEALARGGVRLATALLAEDRRLEEAHQFRIESLRDVWARENGVPIHVGDGATLRLKIEDAGERLDLNALFSKGKPRDPKTALLLEALFTKVIDEMPGPAEDKKYDPVALAQNLIDWVDADDVRQDGSPEDTVYQRRNPPYHTPNRPLLSVDEMRLIDGFDDKLVNALRPYVEVYPLTGGNGINPNTAPPWVLALIFHGTAGGQFQLADEDLVRQILEARKQNMLCAPDAQQAGCISFHEITPDTVYPPLTFQTDVFRVVATARVHDVERQIVAFIDRSKPGEPVRLSWNVR